MKFRDIRKAQVRQEYVESHNDDITEVMFALKPVVYFVQVARAGKRAVKRQIERVCVW